MDMPQEHYPSWRYVHFFSGHDLPIPPGRFSTHFFWARNALFHALGALGIARGDQVLVPAYLCRAAIDPIIAFGAQVEFYAVDRQCRFDLGELEARITPRTKAVLAVHYFGFSQPMELLRSLCDRRGLFLIEDCAHVLQLASADEAMGGAGDASVFSRRKFLPVYDGGELWLKSRPKSSFVSYASESPLFTLKVAKCLVDRALEHSNSGAARLLYSSLDALSGSVKRVKNWGRQHEEPVFALDSEQVDFAIALVNHRMSRLSRWLMRHCDIKAIVEARRANFLFLLQALNALPGVQPLFRALPSRAAPWVFPVYFERLHTPHLHFRKAGVPAVNWAGVRPKTLRARDFPDADFLYENLVLLPIHQDLTSAQLQEIVAVAEKAASNGRRSHAAGELTEMAATQ